jgi:hypothetical protein
MRNIKLIDRISFKWGGGQRSRYSDSLRDGRSGDRLPVGARFSAPVHIGPGAHPAPYTMGTGSFPGGKRSGRGVDYPSLSNAEVKERVGLYLYSPSGPSWFVLGRTVSLPCFYLPIWCAIPLLCNICITLNSPTCFGQYYAHLQEVKIVFLQHLVSSLSVIYVIHILQNKGIVHQVGK